MPAIIEPETVYVDDLPGIWTPVQWELSPAEREMELENQATASLLWAIDVPEAVLRLLLSETEIERAYEPPRGYNPAEQGEWDASLVTFQFKRNVRLGQVKREQDHLYVEYTLEDLGTWALEIDPERVTISRL